MGGEQAKASDGPSWMKSRKAAIITTAIVVAVVFSVAIFIILSPAMSPLASIHDADGDGYADSVDEFPEDASEWNDLDGDSVGDNSDAFPDDADETSDSDSDGVGDNSDAFPEDPSEWNDADEDGVGDNSDAFPDDADETSDSDSDGVGDNSDAFPNDPTEWSDTDGDGWGDNTDVFPEDPDQNSPETLAYTEVMSDRVLVEFLVVNPEFPWDDLRVAFSTGSETVVWEPRGDDLDGDVPASHDYDVVDIGDIGVYLSVTDVTGDGMVSALDVMEVCVDGDSLTADVEYVLNYSYEPTERALAEFTLSLYLETPASSLTRVPITNGVRFTFAAVSSDVYWSDVTITLNDGANAVSWSNITTEDLDDGVADLQNYGIRTLGDLGVTLIIVDIAGNGMINMGDYFTLTVDGAFSPAVDYTVSIVYEPTDGMMTTMSFSG